jgi:hypothetical protein
VIVVEWTKPDPLAASTFEANVFADEIGEVGRFMHSAFRDVSIHDGPCTLIGACRPGSRGARCSNSATRLSEPGE